MSIATSIAAFAKTIAVEAFIDGQRVRPLSGSVDLGLDIVSASSEIVLPSRPSWVDFRQPLEIRLGHDGRTQTVFRGFVEDVIRSYGEDGFTCVVKGAGNLKRLQYQYYEDINFNDLFGAPTDLDIVDECIVRAGSGLNVSLQGDNEVFGAVKDVELKAGDELWSMVDAVDQILGYKTFDSPGGTIFRRRISGIPSGTAAFSYEEGVNIFRISRGQTMRGIHNAVQVTGYPQLAITPFSSRLAPSPYVPDPPGYIMFDFASDLIETNELAEAVSLRLIEENNRVLEEVEWETVGDPRLVPGMTIEVDSGRLGLDEEKYFLRHVTHTFGQRFDTRLVTEGGAGEAGFETDLDPVAVFTWLLTRETILVAGTPTDIYTVTCDGSASYDPDGLAGVIAVYAWTNNKNADVSATATYATSFTQADMDHATAPTITLTVTDADANTGFSTQTIADAGQDVLVRDLYVAASSRAEATNDGGKTWQTWTPGSGTVISTPIISGEDHSYFGLSDGKLYRTDDYLANAPTLVEDFGSAVNCIWIYDANANRVTVGLADGRVMVTTDADLLGSSTWTELRDFGSAVVDLTESHDTAPEYRVAVGDSIIITVNEFATEATLITFTSGTARKIIPSIVGLPGKATATATDPVRSEDGTLYTFVGTDPTDVRAGTHHIRQEVLYIGDQVGNIWGTADAGTEFAVLATLTAGDPINSIIRDGDNQMELYIAAADAAWKSFDGGLSWFQLRDYSAGGLVGLQIGYGGLRALPVATATVVSDTTALALNLWNGSGNDAEPAGWREAAYDDSLWAAAVEYSEVVNVPTGADAIYDRDTTGDAIGANRPEIVLIRKEFALGAGVVSSVTLHVSNEDKAKVWVNNILVYQDDEETVGGVEASHTVRSFALDPAIMLPGQDNVIACLVQNINAGVAGEEWIAFRLEVG